MSQDNISYWSDRWVAGETGWHVNGCINPQLERFWKELFPETAPEDAANISVLFPLCGKTYDMIATQQRGYKVIGIEGVRQALDEFGETNHLTLQAQQPSAVPDFTQFDANGITLFLGDFFAWPSHSDLSSTVDRVVDRGSFVAIEPQKRHEYVTVLDSLLKPGGSILLLAMEFDTQYKTGPPNSVTEDDIKDIIAHLRATTQSEYSYKYLAKELASQSCPTSRWLSAQGGPLPDFYDVAILLQKASD